MMVLSKDKKVTGKVHKLTTKVATKLPPGKKRKTKNIGHSARQTFNRNLNSTASNIILNGVEFQDHQTRAAWISLSGANENKGFYTNPLSKAWHRTIVEPDEPLPLYPGDATCTKTMTELFCFDYWVSRRENPECCNTKKSDMSKPWPYMTFLYICPTNENDENIKGESKWNLTEWLDHLAIELQKFMTWTKHNVSYYDAYMYPANIKVKSIHQSYPLAHEVLDHTVVEVIRNLYDVPSVEDAKNDETLKNIFFGNSVNMEMYNIRIANAWLDHTEANFVNGN